MTLRRVLFLVLVGCGSPMTVAELRDAEAPAPATGANPPSLGEAGLLDAGDDGPIVNDPEPEPEPEPEPDDAGDAGDAGDAS